jgi:hypothetical protein
MCDSQVPTRGAVWKLHLVIEDLDESIHIGQDLALPADDLGASRVSQS